MSVTVSEHAIIGTENMPSYNEKSSQDPEHKEELLSKGHSRSESRVHEKFRHTAKGFEELGWNENASMYNHGYRHHSIDSQESLPKEGKDGKQRLSFIKKLIPGGGKEKGEKESNVL